MAVFFGLMKIRAVGMLPIFPQIDADAAPVKQQASDQSTKNFVHLSRFARSPDTRKDVIIGWMNAQGYKRRGFIKGIAFEMESLGL